ncbi:hypothetical protein N0V82_003350 [Gnomoniopsis sp. IMI 355080]|nr:hypothetical protein N0V82_003350 [Gnomoniopsis sp. IMI 355080]
MTSALRLGRPWPAVASGLLHPQQSQHIPSAIPRIAARTFTSTPALLANGYPRQGTPCDVHGDSLPIPKPHARTDHIPAYPYGPRQVYKQSNTGLYGSARIRFGCNVSEKHNVRTPRKWRPNVQRKRLWSKALKCFVQTRVTMRVLRTIDKVGGLDEYLLGEKPMRIKELGPWGWKLRWRIMQSETVFQRFELERMRLGLVPRTRDEFEDEVLREMESGDALEAAGVSHNVTKEDLMAETDRMIATEQDFPLGQGNLLTGPDVAQDEGFMKESKP